MEPIKKSPSQRVYLVPLVLTYVLRFCLKSIDSGRSDVKVCSECDIVNVLKKKMNSEHAGSLFFHILCVNFVLFILVFYENAPLTILRSYDDE